MLETCKSRTAGNPNGAGTYAFLAPMLLLVLSHTSPAQNAGWTPPHGFVSLFDGTDLNGWTVPEGDNGHWKIIDGSIDYDAESEAAGDKSLWTDRSYGDFVVYIDWRIKQTPWINPRVPIILPSGENKRDENGAEIHMLVPDSDSGVFVRGSEKAQVNIWCWPIGSGEIYGYRTDKSMPAAVRAAVTPKLNADRDIGQWNTFKITLRHEVLTVELNGQPVISGASLPGVPARGRIGLQHHGTKVNGQWITPPSLVQFRRIYIKEL
jgi:hypothetical protein